MSRADRPASNVDVRDEPALASPNAPLVGRPGSRSLLSTPALILDLDILEANIAAMAEHATLHRYALRPVTKIHKSTRIALLQQQAGGLGTCCSTLAEAETMVDAGIRGVLLFTPVVTAAKLQRLTALNARADDLLVAVDSAVNIDALSEVARHSGRPLQLLVDVEVGQGRTGVPDPTQAIRLARLVEDTDGLDYRGIQAYMGSHQAVPDLETRTALEDDVLERTALFVKGLTHAGLPPQIVTGGATGSHDIDYLRQVLTEVQVGSYVFMDGHYHDTILRRDDPHPFGHSLTVATSVISNAQPGFVVTDGGAKEVDWIRNKDTIVVASGAPRGSEYRIVGDDMGRLNLPASTVTLPLGARIDLIPPHCYQTVVLHQFYHCVRGDTLVDIWPIDALSHG